MSVGLSSDKSEESLKIFFYCLHPFNFLYACFLTFHSTVYYADKKALPAWLLRAFKRVSYEDHLTYDDWVQIRDDTWSEWKRIVSALPSHPWEADLFDIRVGFHRIGLQRLALAYLSHRWLLKYIERVGLNKGAALEGTLAMGYIRRQGAVLGIDIDGGLPVAKGTWIGDALFEWSLIVGHLLIFFLQVSSAFRKGKDSGPKTIVHDGLAVSESGAGLQELSFAWIIDRKICTEDQILFLLGGRPKRRSKNILHRYYMLTGIGWRGAIRALRFAASVVGACISSPFSLERLRLTEFQLRCIAPYIMARERGVRVYMTTVATLGREHPCVAVYNVMGIRTVLWCYSSNDALFNTHYRSPQRYIFTAHMEPSECWLWSDRHQWRYSQGEILPSQTKYKITGPMMMADATPCLRSAGESRRAFLGLEDEGIWRNLAVFDINPVSKKGQEDLMLGPLAITLEMVEAFYQHLERLLKSFPDIRLIVKSKRRDHPHRVKPPTLNALVENKGKWVQSGRVINLDPDINPYLPIGAADFIVALPFSSPVLAGLHFGRRGLYHDPLGLALKHHYHDLDEMISHDYEDFERKVRYWLYDCTPKAFQTFLDRPETRRFLGPHPGADPAEEFGKALWGESFTLPPATGGMSHERDNGGNRALADSGRAPQVRG